jgi:hypothetical protein
VQVFTLTGRARLTVAPSVAVVSRFLADDHADEMMSGCLDAFGRPNDPIAQGHGVTGMAPRGKGYRLAQTSIRKAFMPMRTRMRTHRAYESCSCIFHAAIQDTNRHKAAKNQKHSSRSIFHKRNLPMVGVCQLHRLVMRLRPAESSRGLSRRPVGAYARNSAQASGSFRVNAASTFLLGASYGRLHELGGPRSITFDQ